MCWANTAVWCWVCRRHSMASVRPTLLVLTLSLPPLLLVLLLRQCTRLLASPATPWLCPLASSSSMRRGAWKRQRSTAHHQHARWVHQQTGHTGKPCLGLRTLSINASALLKCAHACSAAACCTTAFGTLHCTKCRVVLIMHVCLLCVCVQVPPPEATGAL